MVLVIIAAIAVFLIAKAVPALRANTANFWTFEGWFPNDDPPKFGIGALAFGTVLTAAAGAARSRCRWRWASRSSCPTTRRAGSATRSAS